jgi:transposase-like protein
VIRAARDLLPDPGRSITSIAKLLGVSPGTLYNHIPDLKELRTGAVPRQLEAPVKPGRARRAAGASRRRRTSSRPWSRSSSGMPSA